MGMEFTPGEIGVLYRLLAESTADIMLKTDRAGFIVHASPDLDGVGLHLAGGPIGRHLLDLVHPSCAAAVMGEHAAAIAGRESAKWVEFPALSADRRDRWFEIQTRGLVEGDAVYGAVSVMRSIEEKRSFEEKLFAAAMTDPLTGLTNRSAFVSMLEHLIETGAGGCLAMFDIDHFKAINMRYGHTAGDEVLVVFADLIRAMTRGEDVISRIGGESFAVLLPRAAANQATAICAGIVETLSATGGAAAGSGLAITASAGMTCIGACVDDAIRRAELALAVAKAKGRNRLEVDRGAVFGAPIAVRGS